MAYSSSAGCRQGVNVKVDYILYVHVIHKDQVVGNTTKGIRIFADGHPQPPICLAHFPSEYTCRQSRVLRKRLLTRTASLTAEISEPKPFVFHPGQEYATTVLPLLLLLDHINAAATTGVPVKSLEISLAWKLKSLTFASVAPMRSTPTMKDVVRREANKNPPLAVVSCLGRRHELRIPPSGFRCNAPQSPNGPDSTLHDVWTKFEALPISLPNAALLVPTFFTPHVSRRYSLIVQINVSGYGKASMQLEVPVQIAYRAHAETADPAPRYQDVCGMMDPPGVMEADPVSQLPIYVP